MIYRYFDENLKLIITNIVRRQKNVVLRFKENELYISSPNKLKMADINTILSKYKEEILKNCFVTKENNLHFFGNKYSLVIKENENNKYEFKDNELIIYTKNVDPDYVKNLIKDIYKKELAKKAIPIFAELKKIFSIDQIFKGKLDKLKPLGFTSARSYYGICYPKRMEIKLSIFLAKYPENYITGVLCHELCHLEVQSHNEDFHNLLSNYVKDEAKERQNLKKLAKIYRSDFI